MTKPKRWAALLLAVCLLAGMANALAEQPMETMLSKIPADAFAWDYLSFVDYRTLLDARPGVALPPPGQELSAFLDSPQAASYRQAMLGVAAGFAEYNTALMLPLGDALGITRQEVTQSMEIGLAPQNLGWLAGAWDASRVEAALAGRGYQATAGDGPALWCPDGACDQGDRFDLAQRDPAFPFGGMLGARWPILWDEHNLIGSRSAPLMQALLAQGKPKLLDSPRMQMLLYGIAWADENHDRPAGRLTQLLLTALPAPASGGPTHIAIAHMDEEAQWVMAALLFPNILDAMAWAEPLMKALPDAVLGRTGQSLSGQVASMGGTVGTPRISGLKDGEGLLVVPFRFPSQAEALQDDPDAASALPFAWFAKIVHTQDLGWLGL